MATKANLYVRAPIWAANDRVELKYANIYAKTDTIAGTTTALHGTTNVHVFGTGTKFTRDLKVGDNIVANVYGSGSNTAWRELKVVTAVTSDTNVSVETNFVSTDTGNMIQKVDYVCVNSAYGWAKGQVIRGSANTPNGSNTTVMGSNTSAFTTDLQVGDQVVFFNENVRATREVTEVTSATIFVVDSAINLPLANAAAIIRIEEILHAAKNLDTRIDTDA